MLLGSATAAVAHEGVPGIRVELDELDPVLSGVQVTVVTSVTEQLVVANPTDLPLEILDDGGTPFLRLGPDGVEANLLAAAWYTTNEPFGVVEVPERASAADDDVEWQQVAREPSWGWFDHRLHPEGLPTETGDTPRDLATWGIPVRLGEQAADITGRIVYAPVRGTITASLRELPDLGGVTVTLLPGDVPGVFVDNGSDEVVVVLGGEGEPFLRLGPRGVDANIRSPSWLAASRAAGDLPEGLVDAQARPRWRSVSAVPRFGWIEPRAGYPAREPPEAVVSAGQAVTLTEWSIPLRIGGRRVDLYGQTRWEPLATGPAADAAEPAGAGTQRILRPLAAVITAGVAAWALARMRRRGA